MPKALIFWDVDDVLNNLMYLCINSTAQTIKKGIKYSDLRHNPPLEELGCEREVFTQQLDLCRTLATETMAPRPELLCFFKNYGKYFRSAALTAAPITMAPLSSSWVLKHFGTWIHSVTFVPSPRKGVDTADSIFSSKAEAVIALGGILVDDSPHNVESVWASGGKAFYFPAPWNPNRNLSIHDFLQQLLKEVI